MHTFIIYNIIHSHHHHQRRREQQQQEREQHEQKQRTREEKKSKERNVCSTYYYERQAIRVNETLHLHRMFMRQSTSTDECWVGALCSINYHAPRVTRHPVMDHAKCVPSIIYSCVVLAFVLYAQQHLV